jgi:RimJ/RimL family protein N-acetyltransferase
VKLSPIGAGEALEALVERLAPGFGGETDAARALLSQTLDLLTRDPRPDPWGSYLALEDEDVVGICAFKAAPDAAGEVELAYMTFPAFERRGHATAMAARLATLPSPAAFGR